jgi:hypothetical protein
MSDSMINSTTDVDKEIIDNTLKQINIDILNNIKYNYKYGGFDEEGNYLVSLFHSKTMFKDYLSYASNWSSNLHIKTSYMNKVKSDQNFAFQSDFIPKVNKNTDMLYNNYRKRLLNDYRNSGLSESNISEYYKIIEKKNNMKEVLYQKHKAEREETELKQCTFKPKLTKYEGELLSNNLTREERFGLMYKKGVDLVKNKKNRPTEEYEYDKNIEECTFKPKIASFNNNNLDNKYYNKEDYIEFNERMKRGRVEKEIKDSVNMRGEYITPTSIINKRNKSEEKLSKDKKLSNTKEEIQTSLRLDNSNIKNISILIR